MDPTVLQNLIATPAEGEEEFLKALKGSGMTDQEKIDAAVASFRVQKGMKDLVDQNTMAAVVKAAGYVIKATKKEEGVDPKKPDVESGKVDPEAKKKNPMGKSIDLSALDADTRAQVEAVFKSQDDAATKSEKMEEVVKSLTTTVQGLKDAAEEKTYVAKAAADFGHIPMEGAELGLMLKSAHSVGGDFAKGFEALLGRMDEMVQKSDLMTTMGNVHKNLTGGAWDKIQKLADGIVQKSAENAKELTQYQAIDLVLKSANGQALYREYLGDNPRQRGDVY